MDDWKKALGIDKADRKMLQASFANKGSKPYMQVGEVSDIKVGIKPFGFGMPFVAVGVRMRVEWKPGDYELSGVSAKLKMQVHPGQTSYNGSQVFMMPLMFLPTDPTSIRKRWDEVKGATAIAEHIVAWGEDIGLAFDMDKESIVTLVEEGFVSMFPDIPYKPIEPNVAHFEDLNTIYEQAKKS